MAIELKCPRCGGKDFETTCKWSPSPEEDTNKIMCRKCSWTGIAGELYKQCKARLDGLMPVTIMDTIAFTPDMQINLKVPDNKLDDYRVEWTCGCVVTFSAESNYKTSRMDPCHYHSSRRLFEERTEIVNDSRQRMEEDFARRIRSN